MAKATLHPEFEALRRRLAALAEQLTASAPGTLEPIVKELRAGFDDLAAIDDEFVRRDEAAAIARHDLEEERARYRELFDLAPEAYLATNAAGVIREANNAAADLLHVKPEYLVGKPIAAFVLMKERPAFRAWLADLPPVGAAGFEANLSVREGTPIAVGMRVAISAGRTGKPARLRWLLRDVTERRRAEAEAWEMNAVLEARVRDRTAELEAANRAKNELLLREREARSLVEGLLHDAREADHRKDDFLAMLAHELRNPLAPIVNALRIIETSGEATEVVERARQIAERQVRHLVRMVDDLLDVSRVQRGLVTLRKQPLDLGEAFTRAAEAERELILERAHELLFSTGAEALWIDGDSTRIEQVFVNLINNAVKYTPQGGKISLTASREGDDAVVRVRDNGVGIPPDVLPHVFEPFTQARQSLARSAGGLGLGLALVKRLVEMHGGQVSLKSSPTGTEATVRLPLRTPPTATREVRPAVGSNGDAAPLRVLIVDDNVDAAESLAEMLRIWGYEPTIAYDGPSAIDHARRVEPQAVLLDIGLPGMDGFEVAQQLRELGALKQSLLVAITGYGRDSDREAATKAGFDRHLTKPVDPSAIREILSERAGARA